MDPALATCARETVKKYSLPSEEYSINGAGVAGEKSAAESVEAAASIVATPVIRVGKPSADEIVLTREITKDIFFRMWGGDLRDFHVFNFDLVDQHGQYMPVPPGMHIYLVDSGPPDRDLEVFPIEKSYQPANNQTNVEELDPDWETFIVGEGTRLRFRSPDVRFWEIAASWTTPRLRVFSDHPSTSMYYYNRVSHKDLDSYPHPSTEVKVANLYTA